MYLHVNISTPSNRVSGDLAVGVRTQVGTRKKYPLHWRPHVYSGIVHCLELLLGVVPRASQYLLIMGGDNITGRI